MKSSRTKRVCGAILMGFCAAAAAGACYDVVLKNEYFPPGACDNPEAVGAPCGICPNYADWNMAHSSGSYCKAPANGPPSSMVCELGEVRFDQFGTCKCMPIPGNDWVTYYVGPPVCEELCDSDDDPPPPTDPY